MLTLASCNTIDQLIEYGKKLDISHDKLHIKQSIKDPNGNIIIINYSSLIDKYYYFLEKIIKTVTLSDAEYQTYKFQPKMLSYKMYGTTELWSAILRINNLTSASEFKLKTLKLFTLDIFDMLNEILILEEDALKQNRMENGL